MFIIFGIAAGCILAEQPWPALQLPRVNAWWGRIILINSIQLGITVLAGQTWNRWLDHTSIFRLKDHFSDWSSAAIIYFFSTFVYYWWHRYRHECPFYGACYIRSTIRLVALKSLQAFTNILWKF
jgi:sterol desaturase/sphingolipid hydroxylase (fatty acid hydroxylase superfamily)